MKTPSQILKLAEYFLSLADKASYEMMQENLESNPQALNEYLDNAKRYMKDYRQKNPERIKPIIEKVRQNEMVKRKELRSSNSIEALLFKLGSQISNLKSDLKKRSYDPKFGKALTEFEPIAKQLNDLRFNIKEYELGFDHANVGYVANPEKLYKLITYTTQIYEQIKQKLPKISKTLEELIIKMKMLSDNYSQH